MMWSLNIFLKRFRLFIEMLNVAFFGLAQKERTLNVPKQIMKNLNTISLGFGSIIMKPFKVI